MSSLYETRPEAPKPLIKKERELIKIALPKYLGGYALVDAEPVIFPGFEEFSFYVHQDYNGQDIPGTIEMEITYSVTELYTGMRIPFDDEPISKEEACWAAWGVMQYQGKDKLTRFIDQAKKLVKKPKASKP